MLLTFIPKIKSHKLQNTLINLAVILNFSLLAAPVQSQLVPDRTLGTEQSIVIPNQSVNNVPSDFISGGATRGKILYHSFQEFNVGLGKGVYFLNPTGITNILTRVTGSNISNVNGILGVIGGNANLFLLNTNGIIFGPNAQLNLSGSFLATTASSINLADGTQFNTYPEPPLLTISIPAGLTFGKTPGLIEVNGSGQNLGVTPTINPISPSPVLGAGNSTSGLKVQPGQTITLVGGDVNFNGGIVTAPGGQINLGSVNQGSVILDTALKLSYIGVQKFKDIQLTNLSLIDTSGIGVGEINVRGNKIAVLNGSLILNQSQGINPVGNININALDSFLIQGNPSNPTSEQSPPATQINSGVVSETNYGPGTNINITAKDLLLQLSGGILSITFGTGTSGNISIDATDSIQLSGLNPVDPIHRINLIATATTSSGNSGSIKLSTQNLLINAGTITTATYGTGNSGNNLIEASKLIEIKGINPVTFFPNAIDTLSFGPGNAGSINIKTTELNLTSGAIINTSTQGSGRTGELRITASKSIDLDGTSQGSTPGQPIRSEVSASGTEIDPIAAFVLGVPIVPPGGSGDITINTNKLNISNGARINTRNFGFGEAGTLTINAQSITLNSGTINASTNNGKGGDINFNLTNSLVLQNSSNISTNAGINGNGGNITTNTNTIAILDQSTINANAAAGNGGEVLIKANAIFQLDRQDISAKGKQPSFNGLIQINIPTEVNVSRASATPTPTLPTPVANSICNSRPHQNNEFFSSGTGGDPPNPNDLVDTNTGWSRTSTTAPSQFISLKPSRHRLAAATGVVFYPNGTMKFVSNTNEVSAFEPKIPCTQDQTKTK